MVVETLIAARIAVFAIIALAIDWPAPVKDSYIDVRHV
jgi:hypothetical protein